MGWLAFAAGWVLVDGFNTNLIISALPYVFFNTSLYFLTTLPDMDGDRSSKKITFPVRFGFKFTIWCSFLFYFLALFLSYLLNDQFCLTILFLLIPAMFRLIIKKNIPSAVLTVKLGIFFFCLIICLKIPVFFILMFSLFFFTRIYYKKRFNFDYPNFKSI